MNLPEVVAIVWYRQQFSPRAKDLVTVPKFCTDESSAIELCYDLIYTNRYPNCRFLGIEFSDGFSYHSHTIQHWREFDKYRKEKATSWYDVDGFDRIVTIPAPPDTIEVWCPFTDEVVEVPYSGTGLVGNFPKWKKMESKDKEGS